MADTQQTVENIAHSILEATKLMGDKKRLLFIGDEQPFYRALKAAAQRTGVVDIACRPSLVSSCTGYDGVIIDSTNALPATSALLNAKQDIDCATAWSSYDTSCVAAACFTALTRLDLIAGKHIVIIGRGHATKGLAQALQRRDATVTTVHTKTPKSLLQALSYYDTAADVVINTGKGLQLPAHDLIIDVANSYTGTASAEVLSKIGMLTAAIAIGRL